MLPSVLTPRDQCVSKCVTMRIYVGLHFSLNWRKLFVSPDILCTKQIAILNIKIPPPLGHNLADPLRHAATVHKEVSLHGSSDG